MNIKDCGCEGCKTYEVFKDCNFLPVIYKSNKEFVYPCSIY